MPERNSPIFFDLIQTRFLWRVLILACSFCAALAGLAAPWFQKEFVDALTGQSGPLQLGWFDNALPWILLAFASMLLTQGFAQLTNYLGAREALFMQKLLARRLYDKMLALKVDTMSRRPLGEVVSLYATDVSGATVFLDQTLPMGASTLFPLLLAPFAISVFFEVPLWPVVGMILFITLINTALAFRQSRFFYKFKQLAAERIGLVNEWIQNIRTLRILGWTSSFESKIFRKREIETDNRVRMVTNGQAMNSISTSVTFMLNLATLGLLIFQRERSLTAGEMLALLWILGVFLTRPFRQMPWFFTFAFDAWTSLRRLEDFFATKNPQTSVVEPRPLSPTPSMMENSSSEGADWALEIEGLRLDINGVSLLKDVNLRVKRGEFIAIVGEVGSGKSLLLLSLLRETGASASRYRIFGRDAKSQSDDELRSHFAFVPQEGFIMSASLRENVGFDYDLSSDQDHRILEALRLAEFDLSRERVEKGLETEIGERGVNLSGGQKQRVSLARSQASGRDLLLIDDGLSAVDVDTEEKLFQNLLDGAWRDKTRLLVTHRLTILDKVDRVVFLQEGKVVDEGSFEELSERCPSFREFTISVRRLQGEETSEIFAPKTTSPGAADEHS